MDKRLLKRHKRQVARANEKVKISEPDLRTPEEIKAAREASRATPGLDSYAARGTSSMRNSSRPVAAGGTKTDA